MLFSKFPKSFVPPLTVLILILNSSNSLVGQTDRAQIIEAREASNAALKSLDSELSFSFLTDDVIITTGAGKHIVGKKALKKYVENLGASKMYWVRTADDILVNDAKSLAWESGTWKGFDMAKGTKPIVSGNYAAQWTKSSGKWLIKSQLFVTLQ